MKRIGLFTLICGVFVLMLAGCNQNQTPEQVRQETAKATATAAKDAKAVAEGVADGLKSKVGTAGTQVNINTATADELKTLPDVDEVRARRIIVNRPYDHADDLVKKHVINQAEYDRISSQITAH